MSSSIVKAPAKALTVALATLMLSCFGLSVQAQENQKPAAGAEEEAAELGWKPIPSSSNSAARPRWEVGVGAGYFWGYDYPASSDKNQRGLALPFFVYRTPRLRFGGSGLRAVAIEKPRLKLDLSIGGSLNASSQGNSARQGMEDLDFLFEIGPQLEVRISDHKFASGARLRSRFTSELRAVFSTDFGSVDPRGFVADIGLGMNIDRIAGTKIGFIANFKSTFASEELQDYFYEVGEADVTESRSLYDAKGGYLESTLFAGVGMRPLPQVRVFAGVVKGFFGGASNEKSPLYDVSEQTRFALGIVWTIKTSKQMVDVIELGTDS